MRERQSNPLMLWDKQKLKIGILQSEVLPLLEMIKILKSKEHLLTTPKDPTIFFFNFEI